MSDFDLSGLSSHTFEHMVNAIALRVLGAGLSTFGPGPDGGRDGLFEGRAPYPSQSDQWNGIWYIQSKFHAPNLSKDHNKWLIEQAKQELDAFANPEAARRLPSIWILATNVDPSGSPDSGAFDTIRAMVQARLPSVGDRFSIWSGSKIKAWLSQYRDIAERYGHFITPGNVLALIISRLNTEQTIDRDIERCLTNLDFEEHSHAKLDQGGFEDDRRPRIHSLFVDLPFSCAHASVKSTIMPHLASTASQSHLPPRPSTELQPRHTRLEHWVRHPSRAPVWLIKGGPGNGKSTIGQYYCHIQRAALILATGSARTVDEQQLARDVQAHAEPIGMWPSIPRLPLQVDLKDYAKWLTTSGDQSGILSYIAARISARLEQPVEASSVRRIAQGRPCCAVFDGLDEVPDSLKDTVAVNVSQFIRDQSAVSDLLSICTSRPQGYSGQFDNIPGLSSIELTRLSPDVALDCGLRLLTHTLPPQEAFERSAAFSEAMKATNIQELTTSPLQAHILAIICRSGGQPPERKYELFSRFYDVMRAREANRNLPDKTLARILKEEPALLKEIHSRLGFVLHARAEAASGAQASLTQKEFEDLARSIVDERFDANQDQIVKALLQAATTRLVLISTPNDGNRVHFDIRQLQEYFAAEHLYDNVEIDEISRRFERIAGDQHWREVVLFVLGAFVARGRKSELINAIESLRSLDRIDLDRPDSFLDNELGRGALVAASLLRDGSLESDKKARANFSELVSTFAGLGVGTVIDSLMMIRAPSTRGFVRKQMEQVLATSSTRTLGAHIFVSQCLSDGDNAIPALVTQIEGKSDRYRTRVNQLLAMRTSPDRNWTARWLLDQALAKEPKQTAAVECLRSLGRNANGGKLVARALEQRGISAVEPFLTSSIMNQTTGEMVDFGWFKMHRSRPHIEASLPIPSALNIPATSSLGIFIRLLALHATPSRIAFIDLLRSAGSLEALRTVPYEFVEPLGTSQNGETFDELVRTLEAMSDSDFGSFWTHRIDSSRLHPFSLHPNPDLSSPMVAKGFAVNPLLSLLVWEVAMSDEGLRNETTDPRLLRLVVEAALNSKSLLVRLPIGHWHLLFNDSKAAALKERLRAEGRNTNWMAVRSLIGATSGWSVESLADLRLKLPEDAGMLPWLFRALSILVSARDTQRASRERIAHVLVEIGLSERSMRTSIEAIKEPQLKQIVAVLLLIVAPESIFTRELVIQAFSEPLSQFGSAATLMTGLELSGMYNDSDFRSTLGALLRQSSDEERDALADLVLQWRERSHSPVSALGIDGFLGRA